MRGQRFGLLSAERLAVVRINHSLALRARIFSKQKSKPDAQASGSPACRTTFLLCVSGGFGRCALPSVHYRCLLDPPKGEGDEIAMLHPLSSAMNPETVVVLVVPMDSLPSFLILRPNLHGLAHVQAVYCSAANHTAPGN